MADNIARGMTPDDAACEAHRKLGNVTRIREEIYEMNTLHVFETTWQDLRYGLRLLRRNPVFSIVAIPHAGARHRCQRCDLSKTGQLGATAAFTGRQAARIGLGEHRHAQPRPRRLENEPSWKHVTGAVGGLAKRAAGIVGVRLWHYDLESRDGSETRPVDGIYVSGNFFGALGVGAETGRVPSEIDDRQGCDSAGAVLSHGFWKAQDAPIQPSSGYRSHWRVTRFRSSASRRQTSSVSKLDERFDVALPLCAEPTIRGEDSGFGHPDRWFLDTMARLKPGWTLERANAHLMAISPAILAGNVPPNYNAEMAKDYLRFTFTTAPAATGVSGLRSAYASQL